MNESTPENEPLQVAEARSATVTVSVTPQIKEALEKIVEASESNGIRWSVNREVWERLKFTFDLTGQNGDIAPYAAKSVNEKVRRAAGRALEKEAFQDAGLPEFASDNRPAVNRTRPRHAVNVFADRKAVQIVDGENHSRPILTNDFAALRNDYRKALDSLAYSSDANISDERYFKVEGVWKIGARDELLSMAREMSARIPSGEALKETPKLKLDRVWFRSELEINALRECLTCVSLYRFAMTWEHIREDAVTRLIVQDESAKLFDKEGVQRKLTLDLQELHLGFQKEIIENMQIDTEMLNKLADLGEFRIAKGGE